MISNVTKIAAGAAAVVAIGIGAAAVGSASSGSESRTGDSRRRRPGRGPGQRRPAWVRRAPALRPAHGHRRHRRGRR